MHNFLPQKLYREENSTKFNTTTNKWYFHDLVHKYMQMLNHSNSTNTTEQIYLAPPEYFFPNWNKHADNWIHRACASAFTWAHKSKIKRHQMRYKLCVKLNSTDYANEPSNISYTKQHWISPRELRVAWRRDMTELVPVARLTIVQFPGNSITL